MNLPKPSPIALVVCDNVYREPGGKTALVGLFNNLIAQEFPVTHPRMCVYVSVTDMRPNTKLRLEIEHAESGKQIVAMEGGPPAESDPTTICDYTFLLNNVVFPEQGRYYIRFSGNDRELLCRPFEVIKRG